MLVAVIDVNHAPPGKAIGLALIYPEPEKGGRGKRSENSNETLGFSIMRLSQARTILRHSRAE